MKVILNTAITLLLLSFCMRVSAITLVNQGKSDYVIVIGDSALDPAKDAAEDLQHYLKKITGATLKIITASKAGDEPKILVGESRLTRKLGLKNSSFKDQEYLIKTVGNNLILMGKDQENGEAERKPGHTFCNTKVFQQIGTFYAVSTFLEKFCGVRWYWPSEFGEVVPEKSTLKIGNIDIRRHPSADHRNIHAFCWLREIPRTFDWQLYAQFGIPKGPYLTYEESLNWARHLKMGGEPFSGGHGQMDYFERFGKSHPEWFANGSPERDGQLCYTNPELLKQIVQDARDFFDGKFKGKVTFSHGNYFSVMPGDNQAYCRCAECQKYFPEKRKLLPLLDLDNNYASKYVWNTVAKVANEVKKTHPEGNIVCCTYADYMLPPKDFVVPDNVTVFICKIRTLYAPNPELKKKQYEFYAKWAAKTKNIIFWDYYLFPENPSYARFPAILPHSIADDIAEMKKLGLHKGMMAEMEETRIRNLPMDHLRIYVTAKLLDDYDASVDSILDEYYRLFYGPAEKPMRKFWTEMEKIYMRPKKSKTGYLDAEYDWKVLVKEEDVKHLGAFLEEAAGMVKPESIYAKRIDLIKKGVFDTFLVKGRKHVLEVIANTKRTEIPRVTKSFKLTGDLKAPEWKQAGIAKDFLTIKGEKAEIKTEAFLLYDSKYLYLGFRCSEPDMANFAAKRTRNDDTWIFRDDSVEVFIDVKRKINKNNYYHILTNAVPAVWDSKTRNDSSWTSNAIVKTARFADYWTVEMKIPFKSLGVNVVRPGEVWGMNFCRTRPVRRDKQSLMQNENFSFYNWNGPYGYHAPMRFGIVTFK